jgi:uncharacterized protein (TIGR00299 family) protein
MIVGALLDAGLGFESLQSELEKLNLPGFRVKLERLRRKSIVGTKFNVEIEKEEGERRLGDFLEILGKSDLDGKIVSRASEIFERMATAEGKIHDRKIDEVHFHEIGGLDTIVDVVSGLAGLELLGIEAVFGSKVNVGSGFIDTSHGKLPVPAPATVELLKGIPLYSNHIEGELTTPTGAAILSSLSKGFGEIPVMEVETIGYGVGSRDFEIPNLLRVLIGECSDVQLSDSITDLEQDQVVLLETNIDDMNPELFEHVSERLMENGGLDVYITPVQMKKGRPGVLLSLLSPPEIVNSLISILFEETTTLGVRLQKVDRRKLFREVKTVKTRFGDIKVKIGKTGGVVKSIAPEYEDCKKVAIEKGLSLRDVYEDVKKEVREKIKK